MFQGFPITISKGLEARTATILSRDPDRAAEISESVVDFVQNDLGYPPEEAIPGLMAAVLVFALMTTDPQQALDEAVDMFDTSDPEGES